MKRLQTVTINGNVSAGAVNYCAIQGFSAVAGTETNLEKQWVRTGSGTFSGLRANVIANSINTGSSTMKMRIDGADGNLSVSMAAGATGWFEDVTHTDTVATGHQVNYKITGSGASGTIQVRRACVEWDSTFQWFRSTGSTGALSLSPRYCGLNDSGKPQSTETDRQAKFRVAGTLQKGVVFVSANSRDGSVTFVSRKNAADGNISISVTSTSTGEFEDTTHSDSIASTDLANWKVTIGGTTGSITFPKIGCEFVPTNGTETQFVSHPGNAISQDTSIDYFEIHAGAVGASTEANTTAKPVTGFTASNLGAYLSANASGSTSTIKLRQNSSDTSLVLSISASATGWFEDTSNTVTVATGDIINYSAIAGSSTITIRAFTLKAVGVANVQVDLTDTGAGSDGVSIRVSFAVTETSSGTEATPNIPTVEFTITETGSASEAISIYASIGPVSDTGTGADNTAIYVIVSTIQDASDAATDTATVAVLVTAAETGGVNASTGEAITVPFVHVNLTETGTVNASTGEAFTITVNVGTISDNSFVAEDFATPNQSNTVTDLGAGVDAASTIWMIAVTDLGVGTDAAPTITVSVAAITDDGAGSDVPGRSALGILIADAGFELGATDAVSLGISFSLAETPAGADSQTITNSFTATDTGSVDTSTGEVTTVAVRIPLTESPTGSDAPTITVTANAADLAELCAGTDAVTTWALLTITDTPTGKDATPSVTVVAGITETSAGADAASVGVLVTQAETGSGDTEEIDATTKSATVTDVGGVAGGVANESSEVVSITSFPYEVSVSITDDGAGVDATAVTALSTVADTSKGGDAAPTIVASFTVTESGAGSDALSFRMAISTSDSGTSADDTDPVVTVAATVAESSTGVEFVGSITSTGAVVSDASAGVDAATVGVLVPVTDTGGVDSDTGEVVTIAVQVNQLDLSIADQNADAIEQIIAATLVADIAAGVDATTVAVRVPIADTSTGVESTPVITVAARAVDAAAGSDAAAPVVYDHELRIRFASLATRQASFGRLTSRLMTFGFSSRSMNFALRA